MARRAIPMIAFPLVRTIYICLWPLTRMRCIRSLRKLRHSRGLGQLMGVARKRTRSEALQTSRKKAQSCVAYVETGTNS